MKLVERIDKYLNESKLIKGILKKNDNQFFIDGNDGVEYPLTSKLNISAKKEWLDDEVEGNVTKDMTGVYMVTSIKKV